MEGNRRLRRAKTDRLDAWKLVNMLIHFHDLRHTYASLLIDQGENIKYIQSQLGQSSLTVTLNIYAHLMKLANQDAVCRLENTLFGATGHKTVTGIEKGSRLITVTP
jgi:integrase